MMALIPLVLKYLILQSYTNFGIVISIFQIALMTILLIKLIMKKKMEVLKNEMF